MNINSFVNRNPMEVHEDKSPACPFVTGVADNTSLQQRGQASGRHFHQLLFGATSENKTHPLSPGSGRGHEQKSASQGRRSRSDRFPTSPSGQSSSGRHPEAGSQALSVPDSHRRTVEPSLPTHHPQEPSRPQAPEPASPSRPAEPITPGAREPTSPPQPSQPIRPQAPEPASPSRPAEPITPGAREPTSLPQPSQQIRVQTVENGLPYQSARPVSTQQQQQQVTTSRSRRPTASGPAEEDPGRNGRSNQSPGSDADTAPPATPPAGPSPAPAPQPPSSSTAEPARELVTYTQLGIYTQEPKRPDFAIASARVNTFAGWPHSSTHTPEDMAEAGFYYVGELGCLIDLFLA